jgi:hypothetical protein
MGHPAKLGPIDVQPLGADLAIASYPFHFSITRTTGVQIFPEVNGSGGKFRKFSRVKSAMILRELYCYGNLERGYCELTSLS